MAVQFFAPKTLGSATIGAGALAGGGTIYWYQMPRTWRELLVKEGFLFLSTDEDYKGMFNDQQGKDIWKQETSFTGANASNVKEKVDKYCSKELDKSLSESTISDYESTRRKLISFCTSDGINTVKARLIQSKKKDWIGESDTDKWQTVFAIYRYEPRFIEWLKEDSGDNNLDEKTEVDKGWEKLKNACSKLLAKPHKELTDDKYFEYGSWWCIGLGYKTVQEKINKDSSWKQETEGNKIKKTWKDTDSVTERIKEDLSKKDEELKDDDYKQWCDDQLKKELKEGNYYKDKYIMFKSVCKKTTK